MKIVNIQAMRLNTPSREPQTQPRSPSWDASDEVANPMSRFPNVKAHRELWMPEWEKIWCKVTLEDGTWGVGHTDLGRASAAVIEDHIAPNLIGEDGLAIEKLADMMWRTTKLYGSGGIASYAISAVDLALWDAKGRLLDQPVYSLIGGPKQEKMYCYSTGNDVDWYQELNFDAFKLACPYGPVDGLEGLKKNEAFVAGVREKIGDDCELMLDCWMAFDVDYTVRLAERLRPYRLKWIEEPLVPEAFDAHLELRQRLPWQTLATGEHWHTHVPFLWALKHHAVDILQPDIHWCGGLTTCLKIAHAADAAGKQVILHTGGRSVYGQHFSFAAPAVPWLEYYMPSPPGVPLAETVDIPGQAIVEDRWLVPSAGPGFGHEIPESWFEPFF